MASELDIRAQQFSRNVVPLAQQKFSKFFPTVLQKGDVQAKSFSQDQIGTWDMSAKGGLNVDTPENDPNLQRRWAYITTYHDSRLLDRSVNLQILSDPKSEMTQNAARAIGRTMDDVIYAAALGTAATGENGSGSATLPSGQIILNGGTNLTIDKIREAGQILDDNDVDEDGRIAWISPDGIQSLLGDTQATSSDYMNVKNLVNGTINTFYGFTIVKSTRLGFGAANIRQCVFFQRSGIVAGTPEMMFVRTDERNDKSYSWQVYYELNVGAVRLEEEKVVRVDIDETA
jgi:hypothetical protein